MKKLFSYIFSIALLINPALTQTSQFNLMPMPAQIETTGDSFVLDSTFRIQVSGPDAERLLNSSDRFLRHLSGRTGLFFSQDYIRQQDSIPAAFKISFDRKGEFAIQENEAYTLNINSKQVKLNAETDLGAMHGLETLLQLLSVGDEKYYFPGVIIRDGPRFTWRGLLIDVSRHFMPVEVIKRNLDGMAAVKLNVFHWHLSDDQGFRVQSDSFPNLYLKGSDGFYYTKCQVREIVDYAAARGIRVVPEFDVPGHATAMIKAYPELGSGVEPKSIEREWGVFYQALNPAQEETYRFLDKLFGEMAALFPDKYFHIGGDELENGSDHEARDWNENKQIQSFMHQNGIEDNAALQAYFNSRLLKILTKHGKIMVGWDEILHKDMPTNILIQSWRGKDSMIKAARQGYKSILSNGYYIDLVYPAKDHYLNDPLPAGIDLTPDQKKLILGGEATMWGEYVSPETIDSRIWPRTAAIAERLWSPGDVNNVDDMYRRLGTISYQLEDLGLNHIKNYEMMLRRLTFNQDTGALKTLVDVLEPVKHYQRGSERPYTSYSPLTRVVDAARPESQTARVFNNRVDEFLKSSNASDEDEQYIIAKLTKWKDNQAALLPVIKKSPVLKEIESLSEDLSAIAQIGLEAMNAIKTKTTQGNQWFEKSVQALQKARESRGQTEIHVVSGIEALVKAAEK